jgi:lincosamide nucleotidyltransferase A/C/D/E
VRAEDVVDLYATLLGHGVQLWLDGGWGVDALLQEQTRSHTDLDAIVAFDDLPALTRSLSERGFTLKEIWPENCWVPHPEPVALIGRQRPALEVATAFVLTDAVHRELDIHAVRFDEHGRGIPAWNSDCVFPAEAFEGQGIIANTSVRCLSAETQMRSHTGYVLQEKGVHDLRLLHERFGIDYPDEQARMLSTT